MGRKCSQCRRWKDGDDYSNRQWYKGEGFSRCRECVDGYECPECYRQFNHPNELKMHMQKHRPRNVACPLCGDIRFRSGANAVQHVESGYCSCCRGNSNAREQIYRFASAQSCMQRYMTDLPRITNGRHNDNNVPEFPYRCPDCSIYFRHLSQLLQHRDNRHGSQPLRIAN